MLPFQVTQERLEAATYQFLASGNYAPDNLLSDVVFTSVKRCYLPAFRFQGTYQVRWTASFGYDSEESYTTEETVTENGQTIRREVTNYRTVTDWRHASGEDSGSFCVYTPANEQFGPDMRELVEDLDAELQALPYQDDIVGEHAVLPFKATPEQVYQERGKAAVDAVISDNVERHARGDHQRDWKWSGDVRPVSQAMLLPVCEVVYEFKGKKYRFFCDGADSNRQRADSPPQDGGRRLRVWAGFVPALVGSFMLYASGILSAPSPWNKVGAVLVLGAWAYAFLRRSAILGYAKRVRLVQLAQVHAARGDLEGEAEVGDQLRGDLQLPERPLLARTGGDSLLLPLLVLLMLGMLAAPRPDLPAEPETADTGF